MGELLDELGRIKRKIKRRAVREILGTTKGERYNERRLRRAQEEWKRYAGPLSHKEFMSDTLRAGPMRNKKTLQRQVSRISYKAKAGAKLTPEKIEKILRKLDIRKTPYSEEHFKRNLGRYIPGGRREYGAFIFAGTSHTPDFWVNKNIVIEYKVVRTNTQLHEGIGQCLIYHFKYPHVFFVLYDARQGYDAVNFSNKELKFLFEHGIRVIKFPKSTPR